MAVTACVGSSVVVSGLSVVVNLEVVKGRDTVVKAILGISVDGMVFIGNRVELGFAVVVMGTWNVVCGREVVVNVCGNVRKVNVVGRNVLMVVGLVGRCVVVMTEILKMLGVGDRVISVGARVGKDGLLVVGLVFVWPDAIQFDVGNEEKVGKAGVRETALTSGNTVPRNVVPVLVVGGCVLRPVEK